MTEKDFQRIQELLTTNFNAMEERNNKRFDKIEGRLDAIDSRLDKFEREIKDIHGEMKDVRSEVKDLRSAMEEGFDAISAQFNEIDNRFTKLDEKIDRNHQEVTTRIDTLSKDIKTQRRDALETKGALWATHHSTRAACETCGDYREQVAGGVAQAPRSLRWTPVRRRLLLCLPLRQRCRCRLLCWRVGVLEPNLGRVR